jgi:hypothetical protein
VKRINEIKTKIKKTNLFFNLDIKSSGNKRSGTEVILVARQKPIINANQIINLSMVIL